MREKNQGKDGVTKFVKGGNVSLNTNKILQTFYLYTSSFVFDIRMVMVT